MIHKRSELQARLLNKCHDGVGSLWFTEVLAEYQRAEPGCMFIHDNVLEPGASIGEHGHDASEEIYIILDGHGVMKIDGVDQAVQGGDVCMTRRGHAHSLTNSLEGPMHFYVLGFKL